MSFKAAIGLFRIHAIRVSLVEDIITSRFDKPFF
jgi:hypothetical protein